MQSWTETIGSFAALCTTACWIPEAVKIIREKKTGGLSVVAQSVFTLGVALWSAYGFLLHQWPIILANVTTLVLSLAILGLKFLYPS
jgi:MtN3 and saliva related transmembrane protein